MPEVTWRASSRKRNSTTSLAKKLALGRGGLHGGEGRERQPLDDQLHADELQVPARIGEDLVEQALQRRIHRVHITCLGLQVLVEDLDVAGLVEGLRSRVELGVQRRRAARELRGHQQRALFAVQELRQRPR